MKPFRLVKFWILPCLLAVSWAMAGSGVVSTAPHTADTAQRRFDVLPEESDLRILIQPAGLFAHFGHHHVIGGPVISGTVMLADPLAESSLNLVIPVADLEVDRTEWLEEEGFRTDLSESAIASTHDNMLSEDVLDADKHPEIRIESAGLAGPVERPEVTIRISLRGVTRELTVPTDLDLDGDRLLATGSFTLLQTDFGIRPFRALAGGLRVADEIHIRFSLVAYAEEQGTKD